MTNFSLRKKKCIWAHLCYYFQELLPEDVRQQLKEIEKEQSFEELAVLRTIVMNRIKKERKLAEVCLYLINILLEYALHLLFVVVVVVVVVC